MNEALDKLVLECITNAYTDGYEAEIEAFSDQQLAWDIQCYVDDALIQNTTEDELIASVERVRSTLKNKS